MQTDPPILSVQCSCALQQYPMLQYQTLVLPYRHIDTFSNVSFIRADIFKHKETGTRVVVKGNQIP